MVKNSPINAGDVRDVCGFNPWVRKSSWRRAWQPTLVFLLENPMDRGAWWATVHGVAKSRIQLKRLRTHALGFGEQQRMMGVVFQKNGRVKEARMLCQHKHDCECK